MQRSAFSLLAGLIICTLCAEPSIAADDQAKLEAVRKAITELRQQLESTKGSRDELRQSLENSEKDIGELAKKAEKLQQDLRERQQKLNQLREERGQLQRNKSGQQQQVAEHINTAYRMGQQSSLRMLLNQQDPTNVARQPKVLRLFNAAPAPNGSVNTQPRSGVLTALSQKYPFKPSNWKITTNSLPNAKNNCAPHNCNGEKLSVSY